MEQDRAWSMEALMAETRADLLIDQIFLVQLATVAATVGSLVTALVAALA